MLVTGGFESVVPVLPATSAATIVNKDTGEYKKSVVKIPRNKSSHQLVIDCDYTIISFLTCGISLDEIWISYT